MPKGLLGQLRLRYWLHNLLFPYTWVSLTVFIFVYSHIFDFLMFLAKNSDRGYLYNSIHPSCFSSDVAIPPPYQNQQISHLADQIMSHTILTTRHQITYKRGPNKSTVHCKHLMSSCSSQEYKGTHLVRPHLIHISVCNTALNQSFSASDWETWSHWFCSIISIKVFFNIVYLGLFQGCVTCYLF